MVSFSSTISSLEVFFTCFEPEQCDRDAFSISETGGDAVLNPESGWPRHFGPWKPLGSWTVLNLENARQIYFELTVFTVANSGVRIAEIPSPRRIECPQVFYTGMGMA